MLLHPCIDDTVGACLEASKVLRLDACIPLRRGVGDLEPLLKLLEVEVIVGVCRDRRLIESLARRLVGLKGVYIH